jgi:RHS repeat-associated protein
VNQTIVWQAKYDPYGKAMITTASITNNLRFPGQYFDSETNLHYNYFRYYEPETGRYITSDPIGLSGGINTYGYVGGNPLSFYDPNGLGWISKVGKFIYKGGDVTATLAGTFDDVSTVTDSNASTGSRVLAGLSLASELLPVSARDVGELYAVSKKAYDNCKTKNVLPENVAAGKAWEKKVDANPASGHQNADQVTMVVNTPDGPVRIRTDQLVKNEQTGAYTVVEAKASATAPLTKNQAKALPALQDGATATIKGKKAIDLGLESGSKITVDNVLIVRPTGVTTP